MDSFEALKLHHREIREKFSTNLNLRVHRALSWLKKAELEIAKDDLDGGFIFLWVSFNAAYAYDIETAKRSGEQKTFSDFFSKIIRLDTENIVYNLIWTDFSKSIRLLLDNEFIFQPFWQYQSGEIEEREWKEAFDKANIAARKALGNKDTETLLSIIFSRLYTLRNQMVHGGATYNSSVNREQVRDAVAFLSRIMPTILASMMSEPNELWGDPVYPVIKN